VYVSFLVKQLWYVNLSLTQRGTDAGSDPLQAHRTGGCKLEGPATSPLSRTCSLAEDWKK